MKRNLVSKIFGTALAALVIFSICGALPGIANVEPVSASPGIIYVPDDYTKIQWAVDNATSGDTIIVRDGTYHENVDVNVAHLTIQSENGAANCVVNATNSNDHVFYVTAGYVNITGFTVENATGYSNAGIYLNATSWCNISNNTAVNNYYGIRLDYSSSNGITNNTAVNNYHGIYLDYLSNYNMLTNNTVSNNSYIGIFLTYSSNNMFTNNTVSNNDAGIYLWDSSNNMLANNTASNNSNHGISLDCCSGNTLTNNTMVDDGISLLGGALKYWNNHTIDTSNKINGKPIYYWKNRTGGVVPADAGQVILANCTQVTVENQSISKATTPISVGFCNDNTITNNTASNNSEHGIYLDHSSSNVITNNTASNNPYGIYLYDSSGNTINNNTASDNEYGILLMGSSNNNSITNNIASHNWRGIYLRSPGNTITNNTVSNNREGILVHDSSNNIITDNNVSNNEDGISLVVSSNCVLTNNTMVDGGIRFQGWSLEQWNTHTIDISNKVNGKPVYYWKDRTGGVVPAGAGQVILANCTQVTVENQNISNAPTAISLGFCDDSSITSNTASNNRGGIFMQDSRNNTLANNTASNNSEFGIRVEDSSNNTFVNNTALNNTGIGPYIFYSGAAIFLGWSSNNTLANNTANSNSGYGIYLYYSSNNTLSNNTATNNSASNNGNSVYLSSSRNNSFTNNTASDNHLYIPLPRRGEDGGVGGGGGGGGGGGFLLGNGIYLGWASSNNSLINNTASNNDGDGIYLDGSSNNRLRNNTMSGNRYNFGVWGSSLSHYIHDIDTSNKVNGKPVYYWVNYHDEQVPGDAGFVGIVNSTNITVKDLTLTKNGQGVLLAYGDNCSMESITASNNNDGIYLESSGNNTLTNNSASNNRKGICMHGSSNNTLANNTANSNSGYGIYLYYSSNNTVYNNYFNNTNNAWDNGANTWNTTKTSGTNIIGGPYLGGNYWDDYSGNDTNGDGLGDTLLPYNCTGNIQNGGDYLPLLIWAGATYNLRISSTSGGNVTTPGEGTFTYNASEVVNLVAMPDSGYHFVNWTGDVGTIGNVNSRVTTITMNGDYFITANFAEGAVEVDSEWGKVDTPYREDWTIAPNSDILVPASIPGGEVIYVVGGGHEDNNLDNDYGPRFWKSEDSGVTWDDLTDNVWDADGLPASFNPSTSYFNYVVCANDDSDFVAVALVDDNGTSSDYSDDYQAVVISDDGGDNFAWIGDIDDSSAGSILTRVFDMKISEEDDGKRNIALGGVGDAGSYPDGLVFRYQTGGLVGGHWVDASAYDGWDNINDTAAAIDSEAVTTVQFAPSWLADRTVLAVSHTADETYLQSGIWGNSKCWNEPAGFEPAVQIIGADQSIWSFFRGAAAGLALPTDYEGRNASTHYAWVYVDRTDGTGVIYRVTNGFVVKVNMQISDEPWLASFCYYGTIDEGKAIAGLLGDGIVNMSSSRPFPWSLLEDCCEGVQVYHNGGITDMDICCERWSDSCKPPTGRLSAAVFYVSLNKAYAFVNGVTGWDESAVSFSLDDGNTWNQLGLVDTYIDYLSDVAKSADCSKTWVVSVNVGGGIYAPGHAASSPVGYGCEWFGVCSCFDDEGSYTGSKTCDSVWLKADPLPEASEYSGAWIREWCGELYYEEGLLRLAPEETEEALTVYLVDRWTDTVYYDGSEGLGCWEQGSSTVDEISDLAVLDEATIYAVGWDADVAVSDDHGSAASWSSAMDSKVDEGHTIAVLGEGNVLVGGGDGKVAYSNDNLSTFLHGEASFTELDDIGDGDVHVAFDSYFDSNSVIYAAVSNGGDDNGIYRWVIGESSNWKDLGECTGTATPSETQIGLGPSCDPVEVGYFGIVLSDAEGNPETDATTGGVLYAAYAHYDNSTDACYTGVARCLNPAEEITCGEAEWDYLIQGLSAEKDEAFIAEPSSLKICGCLTPDTNSKLWAIDWYSWYYGGYYCPDFATDDEDSGLGRLWTYEDCYAKAGPELVAPADGAVVGCDPHYWWNDAFMLKWDRQCDACSYNLQISLDEDFTGLVLDISGKDVDCMEIGYEPTSGSNPSYVVGEGALGPGSCGTTFYWRVRSADAETGEIIHSPWSEARSFTVGGEPKYYNLTISSTAGGNVTTPGEGTFSYNASEVVDLVATPDTGYQFVKWTGDTSTIGDVDAASTNITMNGDYSITANFASKSRPGGGGGGGGGAPCYLDIDILGSITKVRISCATDRTLKSVVAPDFNNTNFLEIDYGTTVICNELGEAPEVLMMRVANQSPPVPDGSALIGPVYNFTGNYGSGSCSGVAFGQNVTIVLDYDPDELPESTTSLAVAYYDTELGIWVSVPPDIGRVAEVGKATGLMNHFSTVAVIAELAPAVTPASFVGSALNIEQSPQVWKNIFVGVTGKDVTITANVANNGGQEGTYIAELKLNGETIDTKEVTLAAGQSQQVTFTLYGMDYGQYEVEVAGLSGEFTVSRIIDWWAIFGIILGVGLLVYFFVFRKRRARPTAAE